MADEQNPLLHIPIEKIRENPVALRAVNRTSEKYQGLVDSIRRNGVLNPINVREVRDPNGEIIYGLVDGLHRFTGAQDAGLKTIPAQVVKLADAEILEAQIVANIHKVETKPVEYSKQLVRLLAQNPMLTTNELATRLSKSGTWLSERLGLTKLDAKIAELVDEGKINLSNAYALAKLPSEEQPNFVERAMTTTPQEFVPTATARVKEIRELKRQGRDPSLAGQFIAVPHLRKISELKSEMEVPTAGPILIEKHKVTKPEDAFKMGVQWALHMDPESIEAAKQKDAERKAGEEKKKEERKKERAEKTAQEARERVAELSATPA